MARLTRLSFVFLAPFFAALIVLEVSPLVLAQGSASSAHVEQSSESTSSVLTMFITARNSDGTPAELSVSDLELKMDGKPVAISEVRRQGRSALRYCLLYDISGSQKPLMKWHKNDAIAVLNLMQAGRDYGTLVGFNEQPYLDAEGTEPQELKDALTDDAKGGTALYDAVVGCSENMTKTAIEGLRVMFILADGHDNASHVSREDAQRALVRTEIRVYAISLKNDADPATTKTLSRFAEKTGGKIFAPKTEKDVEHALADISGELNSAFALTLHPAQPLPGDSIYKVEIKCHKKNISFHAPQEYFVALQ